MKTANTSVDVIPMESIPPGTVMVISPAREAVSLHGKDGVQEDGSVIVSLDTTDGRLRVRARAHVFNFGY